MSYDTINGEIAIVNGDLLSNDPEAVGIATKYNINASGKLTNSNAPAQGTYLTRAELLALNDGESFFTQKDFNNLFTTVIYESALSATNDINEAKIFTGDLDIENTDKYFKAIIDGENVVIYSMKYVGSDVYIIYVDSLGDVNFKRKSINGLIDNIIGQYIN